MEYAPRLMFMTCTRHLLRTSVAGVLLVTVAGCGSMRLHDAGRQETSTRAAVVSGEISSGTSSVFEPMEANLETVAEVQRELKSLTDTQRYEATKELLPRFKADKIATRWTRVLNKRSATEDRLSAHAGELADFVDAALNRQKRIAEINQEAVDSGRDIGKSLERVKKRLAWLEGLATNLSKLRNRLDESSNVSGSATTASLEKADPDDESALEDLVKRARSTVEEVEKDGNVEAAMRLLLEAAQEVNQAEQERVGELKRSLEEVVRMQAAFKARDQLIACTLVLKSVGRLYPGLEPDDAGTARFAAALMKLSASGYPCFASVKDRPVGQWIKPAVMTEVGTRWGGGTLADYVAADVAADKEKAKSTELVGALGILLFSEREYYESVQLTLVRMQHARSIRLSKINAQQRAALFNELVQGLALYHKGGIKPEEVAQMVLLAGQVGALAYIGARQ